MNNQHEPNAEFISELETHLTSLIKRQERFGVPKQETSLKRSLRLTALFVLCIISGIAAAKTVERIDNLQKIELLLVKAKTTVSLIEAQKQVADEVVKETKMRVESNTSHPKELADAILQSEMVTLELERARLDLDEIRVAEQAPRNELYAPIHDDRDFVSARLQIEVWRAESIVDHLNENHIEIKKLVAAGLVHQSEAQEIEVQLAEGKRELDEIRHRLRLREAFLSGELTAKQTGIKEMILSAQERVEQALNHSQKASEYLDALSKDHRRGLVSDLEFKQAEYQLIATQAEHRIAEVELQLMKKELDQ